jgi:glycerol uptake facilitator-like aquaporin
MNSKHVGAIIGAVIGVFVLYWAVRSHSSSSSSSYSRGHESTDNAQVDGPRQSVVLAINHVFVLIAILFGAALPLVLLVRAGHVEGEVVAAD